MNVEVRAASRKRARERSIGAKRKRARTLVLARPFTSGISKRNLMGGKQFAILRYCDRFQLDAGTGGVPAVRVFTANGVYDPDTALGGHQPRGFDQLMATWDHCVVTKSVIKVYADNNAEASAVLVGVAHRDSSVTTTDFRDYMEYGPKKTLWMASKESGDSAKMLTYAVNPPEFLGRGDPLSDPDLKNSAGSNAIEGSYFHVYAYPGNTGDSLPVNVIVELEYHCWFIEPKLPPLS